MTLISDWWKQPVSKSVCVNKIDYAAEYEPLRNQLIDHRAEIASVTRGEAK